MTGAWHKALYFLEAATPSVRQYARFCSFKRNLSEMSTFHIDSTAQLQEAINSLPEGLFLFYFVSLIFRSYIYKFNFGR